MTVPDWQEQKLRELQALQQRIRDHLRGIVPRVAADVDAAIREAYNRGDLEAVAELGRLAEQLRITRAGVAREEVLRRLTTEATWALLQQHERVLRSVSDVYRRVIQQTISLEQTGVMTRRQAAQRALNEFAAKGVTSYVDSSRRVWSMTSYTEMTMRTAVQRASLEGHLDRLRKRGKKLVFVSDHTEECQLCRPWEGKVLSLDPQVIPPAVATLDEARARGLMHPNCRHTVGLYVPELTELPTRTEDPEGDAARQRLRAMERKTREWRKREAAAITPREKERARAKVQEWRDAIEDHVATTSAKRQPFREREQAR